METLVKKLIFFLQGWKYKSIILTLWSSVTAGIRLEFVTDVEDIR